MSFGLYLKELRANNNLTQRELAKLANISNAEISRIESGFRVNPSPDVLRAIAPHLNLPYESLMEKAGYLNLKSPIVTISSQLEDKFNTTMTNSLIGSGWSVDFVKHEFQPIGDILAKKDKDKWFIIFNNIKSRKDNDNNFRNRMQLVDFMNYSYGRIVTYNEENLSKISIAVEDINCFNKLKEFPPRYLNIKSSIILIDLELQKVLDEYIYKS